MCEKCPEKVDALISNEVTQFTEEDKEWLNELPEDMLDKFIPKIVKVNAELKAPTLAEAWEIVKTQSKPEDFISNIPEEVKVQINSEQKAKEEREAVIQNLLANSDWTEEEKAELYAAPFSILKKLDIAVKPDVTNYAVVPSKNRKQVSGVVPMPLPGVEFE